MKLRFSLLVFFTALVSNVNASDLSNVYAPDIKKIIDRGEIHFALQKEDQYPDYFHDKSGNLMGSDIVYATKIANDLGVKPVFDMSATSYDDVINLVASGKDDLAIAGLSPTLARARLVNFSTPYASVEEVLVTPKKVAAHIKVRKNHVIISASLGKLKIGTLDHSSYMDYANDLFASQTIVSIAQLDEADHLLSTNQVHAYFTDINTGKRLIADKKNWTLVKVSSLDHLSIAVNPNYPNLLHWVNLFVSQNTI